MLDPEFMKDLRANAEVLDRYLTREKMLEMVNYLIVEPGFEDDHSRCFSLPYIACEVFVSNTNPVLRALFEEEG